MPIGNTNLMRVSLTREEKHQIRVKAAKADKPMARFVADHLRQSLQLNVKRNGRR